MKALSGKALCKRLEQEGWELLRVHGSHRIYGKPGNRSRITVPVHGNRPLKKGLLIHLLRVAEIEPSDE